MKKFFLAIAIILCSFMVRAQGAEVSEGLKEVYKSSEARFYTFNYPSKCTSGEDVVL